MGFLLPSGSGVGSVRTGLVPGPGRARPKQGSTEVDDVSGFLVALVRHPRNVCRQVRRLPRVWEHQERLEEAARVKARKIAWMGQEIVRLNEELAGARAALAGEDVFRHVLKDTDDEDAAREAFLYAYDTTEWLERSARAPWPERMRAWVDSDA
jgi:hypothetical protein